MYENIAFEFVTLTLHFAMTKEKEYTLIYKKG